MFHYASPLLRILSFRARHTSAKLVSNSEILLGLSRSLCVSLCLFGYRGSYLYYPEEHAKIRLVWQQAHEKRRSMSLSFVHSLCLPS